MLTQQILNGLAIGMAYALIAVGFSLVFGILRLVNFSHGALFAFGANVAIAFIGFQFGVIPAILLSILVTALLGVVVDKLTLEPLRKKKSTPTAALITTIGVSYIIQNLLVVWRGSESRHFPTIFPSGRLEVGDASVSIGLMMVAGVSLLMMLALVALVRYTKIGLGMKAVQQNPKAASLMGVNVNFIITFTFFLAGATAAIAGNLISAYYQVVSPMMGFEAGLRAFSAVVLGGIGSLPGAVAGGLIIGLSETLAATFLGSAYRDAAAFVILILVLIVRPTGLFGKKDVIKV